MRPCIRRSAKISLRSPHRSDALTSAYSPLQYRAGTAISNSSSARAVVERIVIDHVGHLGDGIARVEGRSLFVPYTLGGETVEATTATGHPDRRQLIRVEQA